MEVGASALLSTATVQASHQRAALSPAPFVFSHLSFISEFYSQKAEKQIRNKEVKKKLSFKGKSQI